jgi:hypothetical protein
VSESANLPMPLLLPPPLLLLLLHRSLVCAGEPVGGVGSCRD